MLSAIRGRTTHELLPFSGQTAGLVHEILPATEIVEKMVSEAELALTQADGFRSPGAWAIVTCVGKVLR